MSNLVTNGALLKCSVGAAPGSLIVLPVSRVLGEGNPIATLKDAVPLLNIPTFGACAICPMCPCVPITAAWMAPSTKVLIGGMPAITKDSKLMCAKGGMIEVLSPGQTSITA